mmetsp:Transcript_8581/g.12652  ORF Transcript_8581/g.12652 Transcript_8581/m.12652 type:complete len:266 (+) Transcript_8581:37-834(+)
MKENPAINSLLKKYGDRFGNKKDPPAKQESDMSQPRSSSSLSELFKAAKSNITQNNLTPSLNPASSPHSVSPVGKFLTSKRNEVLANSTRFRVYPENRRKRERFSKRKQQKATQQQKDFPKASHLQLLETRSILHSSFNKTASHPTHNPVSTIEDERNSTTKPTTARIPVPLHTFLNHHPNKSELSSKEEEPVVLERAPSLIIDSKLLSSLTSQINAPKDVICYGDDGFYKDLSEQPLHLLKAIHQIEKSTIQLKKLMTTVKQLQ